MGIGSAACFMGAAAQGVPVPHVSRAQRTCVGISVVVVVVLDAVALQAVTVL